METVLIISCMVWFIAGVDFLLAYNRETGAKLRKVC
jgi:hypothetical protein